MHSNTNNYEEPYETMNNENKYTTRDKKRSLYNSSMGINSIKDNKEMESNFIDLSKNANIYKGIIIIVGFFRQEGGTQQETGRCS